MNVCHVADCNSDAATRLCGVCDGWFCDEHHDHGPVGDGPHGAGRLLPTCFDPDPFAVYPVYLDRTCVECPEQYDAYLMNRRVGYLRLRHGRFEVLCPDAFGESVFSAHPIGHGRFTDEERAGYLEAAKAHILLWIERRRRR